jgi:phage terminase Nu1 subunit (DNA packaging protein)
MWASGKDFAAQRGVHPSRVSQWKRQGRLVLNADGRIDVEASHAKLNASLDKAKGERRDGNITSSAPAPAVGVTGELNAAGGNGKAQDEQVVSPKDDSGYWQHKARREKAEAELAELKALQAAGALVSAAGVKRERAETARKVRNAMLAIPDRIAPVVDPANPARAHKLMTDEIQKGLRELSTELEERAAAAARVDEPAEAVL